MGVGIRLVGNFSASRKTKSAATRWLGRVRTFVDEFAATDRLWGNLSVDSRLGESADGEPTLFLAVHPAAEEVEVTVPAAGHVVVSAKTSTVGPGYHVAVCDLFARAGEHLKVRWRPESDDDGDGSLDETGYFFTGDAAAVEAAMLLHLKAMARITLEMQAEADGFHAWNLPLGHSFSKCPGVLKTPMGPRGWDWVKRAARDPRAGLDLYPWWEAGPTADFFFGRALYALWMDVRWRPTINAEEFAYVDGVCGDLCRAYALDPARDYPWREWLEVLEILDEAGGATDVTPKLDKEIRRQAGRAAKRGPRIGYRRYPVLVTLWGGWSITIPGSMAEKSEGDVWGAQDGERTVLFSCWTLTGKDGFAPSAKEILNQTNLEAGKPLRYRKGKLLGKATVQEADFEGQSFMNLRAYSAVPGRVAMCNILYKDPDDFDWAVETWHSLTGKPA